MTGVESEWGMKRNKNGEVGRGWALSLIGSTGGVLHLS